MNNLTSRKKRVILYIGNSNGLNITDNLTDDIILKDSALDLNGFIVKTCTITLHQTPNLTLNPKLNRSRFATGNKITIEVQDSTGQWQLVDTLRVLRRQYKSGRGVLDIIPTHPTLNLECGDRLLLRDTREPPTDEPDFTWDGPRSLVSYVNQWLTYFELPSLTFLSAVPPETIEAPVPYNGGTIVSYLGKLLYAQGRYHLWCDRHEQLRLIKIELAPTNAQLITTGPELPIYLPSEVETEREPSIVVVLGTANLVTPRINPQDVTSTYTNDVVTLTETTSVSYTNTSEQTICNGSITITGLSFNSGNVDTGNYRETTLKTYGGPEGQLTQVEITFEEEGTAPENGTSIGLVTTQTTITDYEYNGLVIKAKTETSKSLRRALENGNNSQLLLDQSTREEWTETLPEQYRYRKTVTIPANDKPITTQGLSKSGESNPPSTDFAPPAYTITTVEVKEEKEFLPSEDLTVAHRVEVNLGYYLTTNTELNQAIATEQGALIYGRDFGQDIGWIITDTELTDPTGPILIAWINLNETEQDVYLINSRVTYLSTTQFYYGGAGIWLGIRDRNTGEITPPYILPVDTFLAWNSTGDLIVTESDDLIEI